MSNLETSVTADERFSGLIEETQASFDQKLKNNIESGLNNLEKGTWEPFSGFPFEKFNKLEVAQLALSVESKKEVLNRIIFPLQEIASKYGISAIYAGVEDQDPHVTLDVAKLEYSDPVIAQRVRQDLHSSENRLRTLGEAVVNSRFKIDRLVIGGPNCYICSSEVDTSQIYPRRFRDAIEKIWERVGSKYSDYGTFEKMYKSFSDIFHISIARIIKNDVDPETMIKFANEAYETVGKSLMENPIIITTDIVKFVSGAEDLQREVFNREQQGINVALMTGAPSEWVEEQRKCHEERNKPYLNRPCVII